MWLWPAHVPRLHQASWGIGGYLHGAASCASCGLSPAPCASCPLTRPSLALSLQLLDKVDALIRKQPTVRGNYEQILGRSLEGLVNRAEELKNKWQARTAFGDCWCGWAGSGLCTGRVEPRAGVHAWLASVGLTSAFSRTKCSFCLQHPLWPPPVIASPVQDQYVSVEELVMAMADDDRFGAQLFREQVPALGCGSSGSGRMLGLVWHY